MFDNLYSNFFDISNRRRFLIANALGFAGWKSDIVANADVLQKQGLSCILIFLKGGPSQLETFDPKPGKPTGGPTKSIKTSVPGIQIAEGWPNTAKIMKHISIVRSLTNTVAEHSRAVYHLHTGYIPKAGVKFPNIGSLVSNELASPTRELPSFVSIGTANNTIGAGFLGMSHAPFVVNDASKLPQNASMPRKIDTDRLSRRFSLLGDLENHYALMGAKSRVDDHKSVYSSAARLIQSSNLKCFDISSENEKVRESYGKNDVGNGCLLARKLVENGVTFVEVESGNWDTHHDHFDRIRPLNATTDQAFAALIEDLYQRKILSKTLVIMMGEFGRSPIINLRNGRDHFPKAFSMILAGAGIKSGYVFGATNADGTDIKDNKVSVEDIFCTFYQALKIQPSKENIGPLERPIKIMDKGKSIKNLFG